MRIVEEPVADGVGQRGLPDVIVPLGWWELARHNRGAAAVAVLEDLEQVAALLVLRWGQAPVVDQEDVHPCELAEEAAVGLVYRVDVEDGNVRVAMTMTTPARPLGKALSEQAEATIWQNVPGLRSVALDLVWDPPWKPSMSEAAKERLGWTE